MAQRLPRGVAGAAAVVLSAGAALGQFDLPIPDPVRCGGRQLRRHGECPGPDRAAAGVRDNLPVGVAVPAGRAMRLRAVSRRGGVYPLPQSGANIPSRAGVNPAPTARRAAPERRKRRRTRSRARALSDPRMTGMEAPEWIGMTGALTATRATLAPNAHRWATGRPMCLPAVSRRGGVYPLPQMGVNIRSRAGINPAPTARRAAPEGRPRDTRLTGP